MKKTVLLIAVVTFLIFSSINPATAAPKNFPIKEISGIIVNITLDTNNKYTIIEFKDGRIITFDGVYPGQVFTKNKHCSFKYQYIEGVFARGTYIIEMR